MCVCLCGLRSAHHRAFVRCEMRSATHVTATIRLPTLSLSLSVFPYPCKQPLPHTLMRIMNFLGVRLDLWNRPAHFMRMSTSSRFRSSQLRESEQDEMSSISKQQDHVHCNTAGGKTHRSDIRHKTHALSLTSSSPHAAGSPARAPRSTSWSRTSPP